jgi:hypothetical protein
MSQQSPHDVIAQLSPEDALAVLKALARRDAEAAATIAEIAYDYLQGVELEEIAFTLYEDLELLRVEEVWDRAGPTRHGYVDPAEVAYNMIEEVLEPHLEQLTKYQKLDMRSEAQQLCMGLLRGLYRFDQESESEFKDWAPDAMPAYSQDVLQAWKRGQPDQAERQRVETFLAEHLKRWRLRLDRTW